MIRVLLLIPFMCMMAYAAGPKPMESITKYNVVLVHGAADEKSGVKNCAEGVEEAYTIMSNNRADSSKNSWRLGGAAGMIGPYYDNAKEDDTKYNLTYWLDSAVFENVTIDAQGERRKADAFSSPYIYIQRAFVNPAESPVHNAHEIGDRSWSGCSTRRSLFEEAQQIRAGGASFLKDYRDPSHLVIS